MIRSRGREDATDRRGRGVSELGRADWPGPGTGAQVRGRGGGGSGRIQIGGLRSDPH
jgi:hypothetical protein